MSEWQPIETAPKDGTYVVLLRTDSYGFWYPWTDDGHCLAFWGGDDADADWYASEASSNSVTEGVPDPTRWMPLPEPPK